jgi:5-formyltetrahydrofolate cyclo-ligase
MSDDALAPTPPSPKAALRQSLRSLRAELDPVVRKKANQAIIERLLASQAVQAAKVILIYAALPEEVNLDSLIAPLSKAGKRVLVPRFGKIPGLMTLWQIKQVDALEESKSTLPVRQPDVSRTQPVEPKEVDLVLAPGLAFSESGQRLGFGGGYYDRFLPKCPARCLTIGIAFEQQVLDDLPTEAHDINMHAVLTELSVYGDTTLLDPIVLTPPLAEIPSP